MTRTRYSIREKDGIHFLTCVIVDWLPILAKPEIKEIVIDSLRFLQNEIRLTIFAYVIMENHIHLIAQANNLSAEITRFKSFTARKAIDFLRVENNSHYLDQLQANNHQHHKDCAFQFWQEGNHPQLIQGEVMMRQKATYIHYNPVRRGYVDLPVHWRYSSARNYEGGGDIVLEVCTDW